MLYLINGMEIISSTLIAFLFLVPNSRFTPDILDTRKEQGFVLRVHGDPLVSVRLWRTLEVARFLDSTLYV